MSGGKSEVKRICLLSLKTLPNRKLCQRDEGIAPAANANCGRNLGMSAGTACDTSSSSGACINEEKREGAPAFAITRARGKVSQMSKTFVSSCSDIGGPDDFFNDSEFLGYDVGDV
jgi:hypothetical protein